MLWRLSRLFHRTWRDDPAEADVASHRLLVRAGYLRRVGAGIYAWLPLGLAVLRNVEAVIREEMLAIGAQEVQLPTLIPARSSRAAAGGPIMAMPCSGCRTAGRRSISWAPPTKSYLPSW